MVVAIITLLYLQYLQELDYIMDIYNSNINYKRFLFFNQ